MQDIEELDEEISEIENKETEDVIENQEEDIQKSL